MRESGSKPTPARSANSSCLHPAAKRNRLNRCPIRANQEIRIPLLKICYLIH